MSQVVGYMGVPYMNTDMTSHPQAHRYPLLQQTHSKATGCRPAA